MPGQFGFEGWPMQKSICPNEKRWLTEHKGLNTDGIIYGKFGWIDPFIDRIGEKGNGQHKGGNIWGLHKTRQSPLKIR
jgi:hypothetical protein